MKYCLSGRQPNSILAQADEIKITQKDLNRVFDYIDIFPNKTIIIEANEKCDFSLIEILKEKINIIIECGDVPTLNLCKEKNIPFFWYYPINSWEDLNYIIKLEPSYIKLGGSLFFSLDDVKNKTNIPIRACPNICYLNKIPKKDGLYGTWIRPEDIETYSNYISTIEFFSSSIKQEASLLHIYKDNKSWPGNLNKLFEDLNINIDNRAVLEQTAKMRMNCGQRCMHTGTCHFCENAIRFAKNLRAAHYKNKV